MKFNKVGFNVLESYSLLKMFLVGCLISVFKKVEDWQEVILWLFNLVELVICDVIVVFSCEVIFCLEMMMDEYIIIEEN